MKEMTDEEITAKHKRIRKTHELKYPPNESRCRNKCGTRHDPVVTQSGEKMVEHQCFLGVVHSGECEFSSVCADLKASDKSLAA